MNRHEKYMEVALEEATRALEVGEFPVGCILVQEGTVIARGHRENSDEANRNEIDHAEVVALRHLLEHDPKIDCSRVTVYSTMEPCLMCYSTMLLSGIRTFVWSYEDIMGGAANLPLYRLNALYAQMEVELVGGILRTQSLRLFQDFFRNYSYWQDSLLSQYTLAQPLEIKEK